MITVDKEQGMATDHGEIWRDKSEQALRVLVDMSITDGSQDLCFTWEESGKTTSLYVPIERIARLVSGAGVNPDER